MSRLPNLRRDELGPDARDVWDSVVSTRGETILTGDGGLAGPFNAFIHAPGVGRHLSALGAAVRFGTSIERRLAELATITIASRWQAEYEWWAHARTARERGVPGAVVDAIGRGEEPTFVAADERAVYRAASELAGNGRLEPGTYRAAHEVLGDAGMVELVSLCGYYTLISFLLNAFDVPLPGGVEPAWRQGDGKPH